MSSLTKEKINTVTPLFNNVLVEVQQNSGEHTRVSGIIIPSNNKESPSEGVIIAVGEGARDKSGHIIPMYVRVAQKVIFGKWSGTKIDVKDAEEGTYVLIKESDLLAVVGGK